MHRGLDRTCAVIAGLGGLLSLAGCGGSGYEALYTRPLAEATPAERAMVFGEAVVACIVQVDRTLGQCQVAEATPDTEEVRDAAMQGARMHGSRDVPPEAPAGAVVLRRVVVGGY